MNAIDRDVVPGGITRELLGKIGDARIDHTICHSQGSNDPCRHAADINDTASTLLLHMRQNKPRNPDIGHQLHVNMVAELFVGQLVKPGAR